MLPNAVAYAIPFFIATIIIELFLIRRRGENYHFKDAATSIAMGLGNQLVAIAVGSAFVLYAYEQAHIWRVFGPFSINWLSLLVCFVLDDFFYYWFHRVSHERRWFWASHVVHHSSQKYNLSTALRQTWTGKLSFTFIFSLPLVVIGFPPEMVVFVAGVNLVYQFWIHTETIGRLGWFEQLFNTPSHHRVHHATNPQYLDANYAGVFIIWDKWFGTFVSERDDDKPTYGIIKNIDNFNPLYVAFHEWLAIVKDVRHAKSVKQAINFLFAAPGWSPDGTRETSQMIKQRWQKETRKNLE